MEAPPVQYVTTSDGYNIAYTVSGEGIPFVFMPWNVNHVQLGWGHPGWLQGLAQGFRLVNYDSRGQGLSTRGLPDDLSAADLGRDLEAVIDRLNLDGFVLMAPSQSSGYLAVHYVIDHPDKVDALILLRCYISSSSTAMRAILGLVDENWDLFVRLNAPLSAEGPQLARYHEFFERGATREDFLKRYRAFSTFDLSDVLPRLRVPTLVLHPRDQDQWLGQEESVRLAAFIPNARMVLIDGASAMGDATQGLRAIDDFLASLPPREKPAAARPSDAQPAGLSLREVEVLRLIAAGKSNPQIAGELVISLNTVQHHVSNILAKTGLANRTEAAVYARDKGLA